MRGAWVAQSVKCLPSAQVMISGSWDRAPHQVPPLGACFFLPTPPACVPSLAGCLYLCQINKILKKKKNAVLTILT